MSFLVRSLLGEDFVHPREQSSGTHTAAQPQHSTQQSTSNAQLATDSHNANRVPTRTLILRVQSCTIAQDRRDALREMQDSKDLPYVMAAKEVSYLCDMLRNSPDDEEIVDASLAILSGITDLGGYPSGSTLYNVSEKEKYRVRDSFLHELVEEVPLFLGFTRKGAFWTRFHSVQLLQRLQEYDPLAVQKLLLSSHGVGVLVDILNDSSHGGALRNEGLVLITAITATDTELQTLLAFDNAFETLFSVINEEGGLDGGVIVSDCLTIVHNMLRNNKATQKLFREMGCARYLSALLDAVPARVRSALNDHSTTSGSAGLATASTASEDSTNSFTPLTNIQGVVVVMAVSIINCVLREAEAQHDVPAAQDALIQCGVLAPLAGLALGGVIVNDAARVEAMRALAVLLHAQRSGIEKFLQIRVVTLRSAALPLRVEEWSALRATLHVLFDVEDRVMQSSAAKVLHTLLSLQVCERDVFQALLKGFVAPGTPSMAMTALPPKAMGLTSSGECGAAIAKALFGGLTNVRGGGQYYAALILDRLVAVSGAADQLLNIEPRNPAPSKAMSEKYVPAQEQSIAVTDTASMTESVFTAFVQYIIRCVRGHGEMDLNTLSACFRTLLRWMRTSRRAVLIFLADPSYYKVFKQRVTQEDGPPHVRFWSAVLCAALCVLVPLDASLHKETDDNELTPSMNKQKLLESFTNDFGGFSIFETLLFDVKASSPAWSDPPLNAFLHPVPVMYDMEMKNMLIEIIQSFKDLCPPRNMKNSRDSPSRLQNMDNLTINSCIGVCAMAPPVTDRAETILGTLLFSRGISEHVPCEEDVSANFESFSAKAVTIQSSIHPIPPLRDLRMMEMTSPPTPSPLNCEEESLNDPAAAAISDAYETQILALRERNSELEQELELYRERERHAAQVKVEELEREKQHASHVAELQETIRLLEEALTSKDEEQQVLAQSLNMLEEQLRAALANPNRAGNDPQPKPCATENGETEELLGLRSTVLRMEQERDELLLLLAELYGEQTMRNSDHPRDHMSLPPPPPSHAPSAESGCAGNVSFAYAHNHDYSQVQSCQVYGQQHAPRYGTVTPLNTPMLSCREGPAGSSLYPLMPGVEAVDECKSFPHVSDTAVDAAVQGSSTPSAQVTVNLGSNVPNPQVDKGDRDNFFTDYGGGGKRGEDPAITLCDKSSSQERGYPKQEPTQQKQQQQQQPQQQQGSSHRVVSYNPFSNMKGPDDDDSGSLI